jgi:glycosyltransferase involved in cell wall biosynthesis
LFYEQADLVVLTSRSEGIPLVLMEAMARGKIVLAPNITGIPELVIDGKTGFLYAAGSEDSFLSRVLFIRIHLLAKAVEEHRNRAPVAKLQPVGATRCPNGNLDWIRQAARVHVRNNFNRARNLESFGNLFIERVAPQTESRSCEDFVLQQI